jgi:hypothetical protein
MNLSFTDPNDVPSPPTELRIRNVRAIPWPDGRRVKVYLEIGPFQERPNLELTLSDSKDQEIASASIIQNITQTIELNLHVRAPEPTNPCTLKVLLYYSKIEGENNPDQEPGPFERQVVDSAQISLEL